MAGAVLRIAKALGINLKEASSELARRGGNGRVAGAGKPSKRLGGRVAKTMSESGLAGTATLEGMATGTHISKGSGKTPKGELTPAIKDRPGELGRLKQSHGQLETKESLEANITGYNLQGRIPRDTIRSYGKSRDEFSEEEEEEYHLANWIKDRRKNWTALQNRLVTYVKEHPDEKNEVSELLVNVRERVSKVTKTWNAKRKRN